jgi:hypothetical protein
MFWFKWKKIMRKVYLGHGFIFEDCGSKQSCLRSLVAANFKEKLNSFVQKQKTSILFFD